MHCWPTSESLRSYAVKPGHGTARQDGLGGLRASAMEQKPPWALQDLTASDTLTRTSSIEKYWSTFKWWNQKAHSTREMCERQRYGLRLHKHAWHILSHRLVAILLLMGAGLVAVGSDCLSFVQCCCLSIQNRNSSDPLQTRWRIGNTEVNWCSLSLIQAICTSVLLTSLDMIRHVYMCNELPQERNIYIHTIHVYTLYINLYS